VGDAAEDRYHVDVESAFIWHADPEGRPRPTERVWVTRYGREVPVREMDDGHLVNTIRMLQRKNRARLIKVAMSRSLGALSYASSAPEHAADAAHSYADHVMSQAGLDELLAEEYPPFRGLLSEAVRRRLPIYEDEYDLDFSVAAATKIRYKIRSRRRRTS
jgi:hypothetical protein